MDVDMMAGDHALGGGGGSGGGGGTAGPSHQINQGHPKTLTKSKRIVNKERNEQHLTFSYALLTSMFEALTGETNPLEETIKALDLEIKRFLNLVCRPPADEETLAEITMKGARRPPLDEVILINLDRIFPDVNSYNIRAQIRRLQGTTTMVDQDATKNNKPSKDVDSDGTSQGDSEIGDMVDQEPSPQQQGEKGNDNVHDEDDDQNKDEAWEFPLYEYMRGKIDFQALLVTDRRIASEARRETKTENASEAM